MNINEFHNKIKIIKNKYTDFKKPLLNKCREFIGLKVKIPEGMYKGRYGEISDCFIDERGNVRALIRPYRLRNPHIYGKFLNDRVDARTFWKLLNVKEVIKD